MRDVTILEPLIAIPSGRATIVLPATQFQNLIVFDTPGTYTFTVTGSGTVEVEVDVLGCGGGGSSSGGAIPGNVGGSGGKATSFTQFPAGTVLTITIGTGGLGGVWVGPLGFISGLSGSTTKVDRSGNLITQADSGGGSTWVAGPTAISGTAGSGSGDFVTPGGGQFGGSAGQPNTGSGGNGQPGRVEIRY